MVQEWVEWHQKNLAGSTYRAQAPPLGHGGRKEPELPGAEHHNLHHPCWRTDTNLEVEREIHVAGGVFDYPTSE